MRVINFVLAAFTFMLGWWTMVGVTAVVILAVVFSVFELFGSPNPFIPDAGLIALIVPVTFCVFLGLSSMDYAKHIIKLCVKK